MDGAAFADAVAVYGRPPRTTPDEELMLALNVTRQWWRAAVAAGTGVGCLTSKEVPEAWWTCQTTTPTAKSDAEAKALMVALDRLLGG